MTRYFHIIHGRFTMVTVNKFSKMLGMNDEELRTYIYSLSENDVKELLYLIIKHDNDERKKNGIIKE